MAWNPSPAVAVARDAARRLKAHQVVIVYLNLVDEKIGMASYGENRVLCAEAGKLGDELYEAARRFLG